MRSLDAELGAVEDTLRIEIKKSSEKAYTKRKITNEKTWKRSIDASASDFRDQLRKLLDQISDLYDEIQKWPEEETDE